MCVEKVEKVENVCMGSVDLIFIDSNNTDVSEKEPYNHVYTCNEGGGRLRGMQKGVPLMKPRLSMNISVYNCTAR